MSTFRLSANNTTHDSSEGVQKKALASGLQGQPFVISFGALQLLQLQINTVSTAAAVEVYRSVDTMEGYGQDRLDLPRTYGTIGGARGGGGR